MDLSISKLLNASAFPIAEVCKRTGLGRTTVYAAIKAGDLVARKYGRRTVVLGDDLARFLQSLPAVSPAGSTKSGADE
ncbi:helix-turn-helix domain-containing protein [Bradyrhizobium septentrionale]|uniref:helix-turn-helix domain-containing protein n=1 Tax=Bradyrhizobium septentrionale TaxID=1404411 RepID=UPI001596ABA3|nr:helix-turn-helix domain-containing protein [Bradyrhizobium septentrionale]UGY28868.1 helix-turn-helix domain-containing protein [Bradyrhizobium septentrionale]